MHNSTIAVNPLNISCENNTYLFYKDIHSVFLGCNINFAKLVGLNTTAEIRGKTDYDLPWADLYAKLYQEGDQAVLDGVLMENVIEPQRKSDGMITSIVVNKLPFISVEGQKIGVVGCYRDVDLNKLPLAADAFESALSKKQLECLIHIAKGMSVKRIASAMNIGERTIHTHIEKLKEKLVCYSKQDLIAKAWQSDFIKKYLIC